MTELEPFLLRALAAALALAVVAAPLGALVIWNRMAYFGETVSQASLIGIALGLFLGIDITAPLRTPGVNVSGIVFSSSGAPAPRVEVHLLADDVVVVGGGGSKGRFVMTDAAGRFTVANMPPGQYVADATLFPTINPELLEQRITPIIERGATSFEVGGLGESGAQAPGAPQSRLSAARQRKAKIVVAPAKAGAQFF